MKENTANEIVKTVISTTLDVIITIFETAWNIISNVVKVVWGVIQTVVESALDLIFGIINVVMSLLQKDWEGAWNKIKDTADKIGRASCRERVSIWVSDGVYK